MSKKADRHEEPEEEFDFSEGVRGKYLDRLKKGSKVVILDPDVAAHFESPQAVNRALRVYLKLEEEKQGAA